MGTLRRHGPPALAALAIALGGPHRERFDVTHGPRLVLVLLLGAVVLAGGRLHRGQWRLPEWAGAGALLAAAVGGALASSPAYALTPLALGVGCGALALGTAWRDGVERERWLRWLAGAAIAVAALGLLEAIGVGPQSLYGRAPSATMGQRNTLGHFLVLASPVAWTQAVRAPSWGRRAGWLLGVALIAAVVVQTRCRAAWLVGPIGLAGFAALSRSLRVLAIGGAIAFGAALSAALPLALRWSSAHPFADTLGRLVDAQGGTGAGRLEEWSSSLALFAAHPVLGVGPGQWFVEWGVARGANHFAHSDWIALLVERGAIGAALVLGLGVGVGAAWRGRGDFALVATTLAVAAGLGALDTVTQLPAPAAWVTLVAFVGLRAGAVPVRARGLAVGVAVLAAAAGCAFASRLLSTAESTPFDRLERAAALDPFDAELRLTLAEAWISAGRCDAAAPHLAAAQRLLPRHPHLAGLIRACPPDG